MEVKFQVAWSVKTPGVTHVSFSGDRTPCGGGLPVIEARPTYESRLREVRCEYCAAYVFFDMEAARSAAQQYVNEAPGTRDWDGLTRIEFAGMVVDQVAGAAYRVQRQHGKWNTNHAFSDFMAFSGLMTGKSPDAKLIGLTALAVLESLKERA
ncbi:hypothetical protein ACFTUC_17375 [Streptomyces sp. NPDC056944]|uniref:hypothetical protein n=1 Tax=Streptomyces sp. NPDC056944 TaxID=3345972 RepID=UPI00363E1AAB